MKVKNILDTKGRKVITIRADATIATLVHRLSLERIGAIVVSEDGQRIDGIISERDIVRGLAEQGAEILGRDTRVADLMTRNVTTCTPDDLVRQVMREMTRRRIRHLPVLENGRLAGVVSIGDIVKHRLEEVELEANMLREAYLAAH